MGKALPARFFGKWHQVSTSTTMCGRFLIQDLIFDFWVDRTCSTCSAVCFLLMKTISRLNELWHGNKWQPDLVRTEMADYVLLGNYDTSIWFHTHFIDYMVSNFSQDQKRWKCQWPDIRWRRRIPTTTIVRKPNGWNNFMEVLCPFRPFNQHPLSKRKTIIS